MSKDEDKNYNPEIPDTGVPEDQKVVRTYLLLFKKLF